MTSLAASYASYAVRVHTNDGVKMLSFDTLAAFFTCTAKQAAEKIGISSRTLIRVCRSLGIRRWPYLSFRGVNDIERLRREAIVNLQRRLHKGSISVSTLDSSSSALVRPGVSANRLLQLKATDSIRPALLPYDVASDSAERGDASSDSGCDSVDAIGSSADGGFKHTPQPTTRSERPMSNPQRISPRSDRPKEMLSLYRVLGTSWEASPKEATRIGREEDWSPYERTLRCPPLRSRVMSMRDIVSGSFRSSSL